ncbi:MAG: lipase secretion chaperone [Neptuniibacter sp.]
MSKKPVLISGLAAVVVIGGLAYWVLSQDKTLVPIPADTVDLQDKNPNAIASQWQWKNFIDKKPAANTDGEKTEEGKSSLEGEVPYDVVQIYNLLQSITLDESGSVVPDQTAKQALENGFMSLGTDLSSEAMSELQDLIRIGLPGEAGEQAALILENYFQFRLAEEEFNQQMENPLPLAESGQMVDQLSAVDQHEKLVQLRRGFLGDEIADQLFAVEDTQAQHMFAAIEIQQNADLTDEDKQAQLATLQVELNNRLVDLGQMEPEEAAAEQVQRLREQGASSDDIYATREAILGTESAQELAAADREDVRWQIRFDGFWQARQDVMEAGLDDAERERQLGQLLDQYFSPEERERARVTSINRQARTSQ